MKTSGIVGAAALIFASLIASNGSAATLLKYTGHPFTNSNTPAFGVSIDISIALDTSLPANFSGDVGVDIASFTLTAVDGRLRPITTSSSGLYFDDLSLVNGHVSTWYLVVISRQLGGIDAATLHLDETRPDSTDGIGAYFNDGTLPFGSGADNSQNPGTWAVSNTVAEPASWALMLLGLGGLGAVVRAKGRSATA